MAWENAALMFPLGHTNVNEDLMIEDLINNNVRQVRVMRARMARDMVIEEENTIWSSDGFIEREKPYSLLMSGLPNDQSCLNVFGRKMVLDYMRNNGIMTMDDFDNN